MTPARAQRRAFTEAVLYSGHPVQEAANMLEGTSREEAERLVATATVTGQLIYDEFLAAWWRLVRGVVLGDVAREDHQSTGLLTWLRRVAS